LIVLWFR
jgi:hypothetical protein